MACKITTIFVILIAIVVASILGHLSFKYYGQVMDITIDPIHASNYEQDNKRIKQSNTVLDKKRLILYGDSRISQWRQLPEIDGYEIINRGIAGDTTAQAVLRIDKDVLDLKPDIVVIQIGINDLKAIGVFKNKKKNLIENTEENIKKIIHKINMRGIQTLLMTILPPSNPGILRLPVWSSDIESAVSKVNTYIRGLGGESVTIIDCDPFFADGNKIREEYAKDTLHLNKQGYNVLVTLVREALDSLTIGEDEM